MKLSKQILLPFLLSLAPQATTSPTEDLSVQVGHHVIFSYPGLEPPSHLFDLVTQGKVGGIILFGENVGENLSTTIEQLQNTYRNSPHYAGSPLFVMTDQEGGQIRRLPGGPESSAKQVGQASNPRKAATQMGKDAASTLEAAKINFNLAPVLDVYRKPGDFTDHTGRSFSNNSDVVGTCGSAFIKAQQSAGIISSAKHFPGLGAAGATENTDLQPVTIDSSLEVLRSVDTAPYKKAIAAGVDMVMSSWAIYPALDAQHPSGFSKAWIQHELRGRLGFKGVTITDALEAGALEAFGDDASRGLLASQAGMDILLASSRNVTQGESVVDILVASLKDGSLDMEYFTLGTKRIMEVRRKIV
ncbi:hypothetical protein PENANT_c003G02978 [Penicillium antarcticum]|uniref:Glycoside hydrolase family 3 N-terminal domain-containing protein n=1 Tax=Penicillium antarcticum TaxID=416450 RepID=A0A1V6QI17_9EURO|nr:uncharacterized protein N7508_005914 [Penicillium antarcticum]KAJ5306899.1 hypothetical protein N7508_005914 [Penicillium antarcticum]OQD88853.1 hypothetical protein PENANT_c003G02978 [Penicillium antarcticum]